MHTLIELVDDHNIPLVRKQNHYIEHTIDIIACIQLCQKKFVIYEHVYYLDINRLLNHKECMIVNKCVYC